jgi:hypothetical protein
MSLKLKDPATGEWLPEVHASIDAVEVWATTKFGKNWSVDPIVNDPGRWSLHAGHGDDRRAYIILPAEWAD